MKRVAEKLAAGKQAAGKPWALALALFVATATPGQAGTGDPPSPVPASSAPPPFPSSSAPPTGQAQTKSQAPATLPQPEIEGGYQPRDKDERGLWAQMDEYERRLKTSNLVVRDPALNAYVRGIFCRLVGADRCKDVRIYLTRTPYFNASMAPNGMMEVWTGLLLRVEDEAQLATVLGHEYTHYARLHSLKNFRDISDKTNLMMMMAMLPVGGWAGFGMQMGQYGLISSMFSFSRDMEREADAGGLALLGESGYDPNAAAQVWRSVADEQDATAQDRGTQSRRRRSSFADSHPSSQERLETLTALGRRTAVKGTPTTNRAAYRQALAPWWPQLIEDQIKLNDFGATEYLLNRLARDEGWTGPLLYARGELYRTRGKPIDLHEAIRFYQEAMMKPDAPVETWRGLGLAELRAGRVQAGQVSLSTYLQKKPDAKDRPMIASLAGLE